jgi:hypothetical protein
MLKKYVINKIFFLHILSLLLKISLLNAQTDEFSNNKKWDDKSLFQYMSKKFLSHNNLQQIKELQYMIIDPNEYLKNEDLIECSKNLELLYKEYKVTFFIFIINSIKENTVLSYQLRDFMYKINLEINKYNKDYEGNKVITALFSVEDNKMLIRVGSECRKLLSDSEALKILKKRKDDLKNKNFKNMLNILSKDVLDAYAKNYEKIQTNSPSLFKIIFYILIFALFGYIYFNFIKSNFSSNLYSENFINIEMKSQLGKKIRDFINKNHNKKVKKLMEEYCLICVENYDKINNDNNVLFDFEESSNEKIVLPCEHIFHLKCISKWFQNEKNCPLCRAKFEVNKKDGNLNITNYILNDNWMYDNSYNFKNIIEEFLRVQKILNPEEINEDFCAKIINDYNNRKENNFFKNVKIGKIDIN